jgi:hypothetical protein
MAGWIVEWAVRLLFGRGDGCMCWRMIGCGLDDWVDGWKCRLMGVCAVGFVGGLLDGWIVV